MNKLIKYITESRFNFNIDLLEDIGNEGEFTLSKQLYKSKSMKQEYIEPYFVDLGLPSGTIWCKYNLGCDFALLRFNPESTSPKDWYGDYYAWGETKLKNEYRWKTYRYAKDGGYCELTKYCSNLNYGYKKFKDNLVELLLEDDVAYLTNSSWSIPTEELCRELIDYTDSKWISGKGNNLYMDVEGLAGRLFTSKINGNQIFIPAAGYKFGSSFVYDGSYCYLWSSSLDTDDPSYALGLGFYSGDIGIGRGNRCNGRSVRSVLNKNN